MKNDPARHHNRQQINLHSAVLLFAILQKSFTFQSHSSQLYHNSKYDPLMTLQSGDTAFFFLWASSEIFVVSIRYRD